MACAPASHSFAAACAQVDGRNVYCKGADAAATAILGPIGTPVRLGFARVVDGRQAPPIRLQFSSPRPIRITETLLSTQSDGTPKEPLSPELRPPPRARLPRPRTGETAAAPAPPPPRAP